MVYAEISYEDCERRGYSSGVEIEGVGGFIRRYFSTLTNKSIQAVDLYNTPD